MTDDASVPRETPPAPPEAAGVFGSRLELAEAYVGWLAGAGTVRGLIGPREVPRLWERHVLNSAVLGEAVPPASRVLDVGTGAGLPGLVLALARPDLEVTLLEPLLRRVTFLEEVVADLGLTGVEVRRGRAEELHGSDGFDVVTSRAVAPLDRLLDWSMPLVAPQGSLLALKGSSVHEEVEAASETLAAWRCGPVEVLTLGGGVVPVPTVVARVAWSDPGGLSWPPTRGRTSRERRGPEQQDAGRRRAQRGASGRARASRPRRS